MTELYENKCEACRVGAPLITDAEKEELLPQIPEWEIIEEEGIEQLSRTFKFGNFVEALDFANLVGEIAEDEGHHPAILVEWGKVNVRWWTHKIKGLHKNDVVMAAKTDKLPR